MIIRQFPVELTPPYPLEQEYNMEKLLFFDIETTGFAAESSYLYLIGCLYYKDSSFYLQQWFSEDIKEEPEMITLFFEFIKDYEVLIHYNGSGFDIPYLQKKCTLHQLNYHFDHLRSIDLYKMISPIKKIFKLNNYKQKSIEAFLGIRREDQSDGGELIQVYQSYLGKKQIAALKKVRLSQAEEEISSETEELLKMLLLHNEDDIKGLVKITPILSYVDLFNQPIRILQAGIDGRKLMIRFELSVFLPVRVSFGNDLVHLTAFERSALLSVEVYEGELKYFYDNYKDYYYLPAEDSVVHKSLALFVDKEYRQKAKPSTCYIKKHGIFAPQYTPILSPSFKLSYQDKQNFIEIHTDFLLEEQNLELYVSHLMQHLITTKN